MAATGRIYVVTAVRGAVIRSRGGLHSHGNPLGILLLGNPGLAHLAALIGDGLAIILVERELARRRAGKYLEDQFVVDLAVSPFAHRVQGFFVHELQGDDGAFAGIKRQSQQSVA